MKRTPLHRTGLATMALALSVSLVACGSDDDGSGQAGSAEDSSESMDDGMSDDMSGEMSEGMDDPAAQTFGPGCSQIPSDGAGSFTGMATEPVATAAGGNPLLSTLVGAVQQAGLVDTLNSADGLTVFAPANDAFGQIPKAQLTSVMKDKKMLTDLLSHHVVSGQLGPDDLAGKHKTLAGDMLEVQGSGEDVTVGDEEAQILCGNIPTANATVYVIDSVLMP